MLKVFNVVGVIVLLLLLRKLIWCLRWLWCWKHDRETPPPIGWLPSRDGGRFDAHVQKRDNGFLEKERGPLGHRPQSTPHGFRTGGKRTGFAGYPSGGLGRYAGGMAGDTGESEASTGEVPLVRQGHGAGIPHGQPRNFLVSGDSKYKNQPFQCAQ